MHQQNQNSKRPTLSQGDNLQLHIVHGTHLSESDLMDRIPCEFFLIRYVPNVVRGEFVNIGVLLRPTTTTDGTDSIADVRFTHDWSRVLGLDPDADTSMLETLVTEMSRRLQSVAKVTPGIGMEDSFFRLMQDSFSNSIQVSGPRATLAETSALELDHLMRMYVEPNVRNDQP